MKTGKGALQVQEAEALGGGSGEDSGLGLVMKGSKS